MKHFTVDQHEHVQVWTIHNPPMNYMTAPMSQELLELVGRAESDANTRAIILTGGVDGKFITHYSVDELAAMELEETAYVRQGDDLIAQVTLRNRLGKRANVHLLLYGYKRGADFAAQLGLDGNVLQVGIER